MRYKVCFETEGPLSDVLIAVESLGAKVHNMNVQEASAIESPQPTKRKSIDRMSPASDAVAAFVAGIPVGAEFTVAQAGSCLPLIGFAASSASSILSSMRVEGVVRHVGRGIYARAR